MKYIFWKILQKQSCLVMPHLYFLFLFVAIFALTNACMKPICAIFLSGEEPLVKHKVLAVRRYKMEKHFQWFFFPSF